MPTSQKIAPALQATKQSSSTKARTRSHLLSCASTLSRDGLIPGLDELAAAAETSRATVYRYFPTRADLVHALMQSALVNLLQWQPRATTASGRLREAFDLLFDCFREHEALFRAVLQVSLQPSAGASPLNRYRRGMRIEITRRALFEDITHLSMAQEELVQQVSILFGIESLVVLRDIWDLDLEQCQDVLVRMADQLLDGVSGHVGT